MFRRTPGFFLVRTLGLGWLGQLHKAGKVLEGLLENMLAVFLLLVQRREIGRGKKVITRHHNFPTTRSITPQLQLLSLTQSMLMMMMTARTCLFPPSRTRSWLLRTAALMVFLLERVLGASSHGSGLLARVDHRTGSYFLSVAQDARVLLVDGAALGL